MYILKIKPWTERIMPDWWSNFSNHVREVWQKDRYEYDDRLTNELLRFNAKLTDAGEFSFESEEDATAFLIRWS